MSPNTYAAVSRVRLCRSGTPFARVADDESRYSGCIPSLTVKAVYMVTEYRAIGLVWQSECHARPKSLRLHVLTGLRPRRATDALRHD